MSARALAWEFRPHRFGLLGVAAYSLALIPLGLTNPELSVGRFVGLVAVPLSVTGFYLLALFSFGFSGDLAARASMYPARLFTLPVSTAALAGWPMLYGTVSVMLLGLAVRPAPWPGGVDIPFWVVLFAGVVMAWMQALTWTAYPIRGLRVLAAVLWLTVMDVVIVVGIQLSPPHWLMFAILAPQLPLAFAVARATLARARRGDIPEWQVPAVMGRLAIGRRRHPRPITTAARAQRWSEWRQHGWSLPGWVAIVLPFASALVFIDRSAPSFVLTAVATSLLVPPLMAGFVGVRLARAGQEGRDQYGVSQFLATRPLSSAALVASKLQVGLISTLIAWVLVAGGITLTMTLADSWPIVAAYLRRAGALLGTSQTAALTLLVLAVLIGLTWKRLVVGMYVALTGRTWLVRTHLAINLVALALVLPAYDWLAGNRQVLTTLWDAAPWVLGLLAAVKMGVFAWVAARLDDARLVERRTLLGGAAGWLLVVASLYVLLLWIGAAARIGPSLLVLIAILVVPLARLWAAPLALVWNRHR